MTTSTTARPQGRAASGTGRPVTTTGSADAVLVALADRPGTTAEQLAARPVWAVRR